MQIFFGGEVDVRTKLLVEFSVEVPSLEEGGDAEKEDAQLVHKRPLVRGGEETGHCGGDALPVFCFHFDFFAPETAEGIELGAAVGF